MLNSNLKYSKVEAIWYKLMNEFFLVEKTLGASERWVWHDCCFSNGIGIAEQMYIMVVDWSKSSQLMQLERQWCWALCYYTTLIKLNFSHLDHYRNTLGNGSIVLAAWICVTAARVDKKKDNGHCWWWEGLAGSQLFSWKYNMWQRIFYFFLNCRGIGYAI